MRIFSVILKSLLSQPCIACGHEPSEKAFCFICENAVKPLLLSSTPGLPRALFHYQGPLRDAIIKAKFSPNEAIARQLMSYTETCLGKTIKEHPHLTGNDAICFVPLHWRRRFKRGYDISPLFANILSSLLHLPVLDLLICTRYDKPLSEGSDREEREQKTRDRYQLKRPLKVPLSLILVDDIITTGATLHSAALPLTTQGAKVIPIAFASA